MRVKLFPNFTHHHLITHTNKGKIVKISCVRCNFMKFNIHFSGSNKKISFVLLQMTTYIFSP